MELIIKINKNTGERTTEVNGAVDSSCEDIMKIVDRYLGEAEVTETKPEYYVKPVENKNTLFGGLS